MKIKIFGLIIILAMLVVPLVTLAGANGINTTVRGKPSGGGSTGGVGSAGPASKAGADGIVKKYALCVGVSNYIDPPSAICPTVTKMPLTGKATYKVKDTKYPP
jgi:hypothetical protein